jgi:hypothetical protein
MLPQARITYATTRTQNACAVMNAIGTKAPMMANAARTIETTKTTVVGGDRFIPQPPSVDERTVIVFCEKARTFGSPVHYKPAFQGLEAEDKETV